MDKTQETGRSREKKTNQDIAQHGKKTAGKGRFEEDGRNVSLVLCSLGAKGNGRNAQDKGGKRKAGRGPVRP